jgi:plastocyanin domain-containing protein
MRFKWPLKLILVLLVLSSFLVISSAQSRGQKRRVAVKYQTTTITITKNGFEPVSVELKQGVPARLTFIKKDPDSCIQEIIIKDYEIKRTLQLNKPVVILFTPRIIEEITFHCQLGCRSGKMKVK